MPVLESLASILAGQAIGKLRESVRPNPYAPNLIDQGALAVQQAGSVVATRGVLGGMSGLAGSEYEYYDDPQGASTVGWLNAVQDVTSWARPPCQFIPGDPGADPADPTLLKDFKRGPIRLPVEPWGVNHRGSPTIVTARINPPTASSPLPRDVAAARAAGSPQGVQDAFDTLYDG